MKSKFTKQLIFVGFSALFILALTIKPQTLLNWRMKRQIYATTDPSKRIVLLNMSLLYPTNYWNKEYLQETTRANTEMERRYLANIIQQRFGTNGVSALQSLMEQSASNIAQSNILAIVSILEKEKPK